MDGAGKRGLSFSPQFILLWRTFELSPALSEALHIHVRHYIFADLYHQPSLHQTLEQALERQEYFIFIDLFLLGGESLRIATLLHSCIFYMLLQSFLIDPSLL